MSTSLSVLSDNDYAGAQQRQHSKAVPATSCMVQLHWAMYSSNVSLYVLSLEVEAFMSPCKQLRALQLPQPCTL